MVDTARFQLGVHAVRTVSVVLAYISRNGFVSPLEVLTWVPLDVLSVARIIDVLVDDELAERVDGRVKWLGTIDAGAPNVEQGEHLEATGFVENLVTLRGDQDWCRKVRDQQRVIRGLATLGTRSTLDKIAEHANIPPPRVQAVLGDFEAEGYIHSEPLDHGLEVDAPDLEYPPDRFERNNALLTNVEQRAVPIHRAWWIILGVAGVMLILFIASRIATSLAS